MSEGKVDFYRHSVAAAERDAVVEALKGPFLTTGSTVREFEGQFAALLGGELGVLGVSSCTAALHLALVAAGVGPGDEVITTPLTFIATANVILHAGATPVLVDVEASTGLIDPACVARAITPRTRAVIAVHLYGQMCDVRRLRALCDEHGLTLIEDAAHAVESRRDGVGSGQLGDAACFSFYATKNLTSGEGGALAARDPDFLARARTASNHGMSKNAADRHGGNYQHWDMVALGYKYNMTNIEAAMLLPQLAHVEEKLQRRDTIARRYDEAFRALPFVTRPAAVPDTDSRSAHHLYVIWVSERRDEALTALGARGIGVAVNYRAIHELSFWRSQLGLAPDALPNASDLGRRCISLPMFPDLTESEQARVIAAVRQLGPELGLGGGD